MRSFVSLAAVELTSAVQPLRHILVSLFVVSARGSPPPSLSRANLLLCDHKFHTKRALAEAPTFVVELQTQCSELDWVWPSLTQRLGAGLAAYASFFVEIHGLFGGVTARLNALSSRCSSSFVTDGERGEGDGEGRKGFRDELATLAKEVARLETVRVYAEMWITMRSGSL